MKATERSSKDDPARLSAGEMPGDNADDLALAKRASVMEEAAWREIYDLTRERLFSLLVYHTGDREEALELLQETYLTAMKSLGHYQGQGPLMAWFAVIAIRRAQDWKRNLFRMKRRKEALAAELNNEVYPASDVQVRREIQSALAKLSKRQRATFLLHELAGMVFSEIGKALGCSEGTARVHYFRARQVMQAILAPEEIQS